MTRLAVQMYSLRELKDPLETVLAEVAAAGYDGVETVVQLPLSTFRLRQRR